MAGRTRLDAYLARAGLGTRSEMRKLVRSGRVQVDGVACRSAARLLAEGARVCVDDELVEAPPEVVHAVLHKPCGYACSHDPGEAPLVEELLPASWLRLGVQPAGRLDRETSGLLVLSSEGGLIHRLTHPRHKLPRRYRVGFEGELPPDAVERCRAGLVLANEERPLLPAELRVEGPGRATLVLREGRYHQVRRMFAALGAHVVRLHRDRIGGYDLPADLEPGDLRLLDASDLARLQSESSL